MIQKTLFVFLTLSFFNLNLAFASQEVTTFVSLRSRDYTLSPDQCIYVPQISEKLGHYTQISFNLSVQGKWEHNSENVSPQSNSGSFYESKLSFNIGSPASDQLILPYEQPFTDFQSSYLGYDGSLDFLGASSFQHVEESQPQKLFLTTTPLSHPSLFSELNGSDEVCIPLYFDTNYSSLGAGNIVQLSYMKIKYRIVLELKAIYH